MLLVLLTASLGLPAGATAEEESNASILAGSKFTDEAKENLKSRLMSSGEFSETRLLDDEANFRDPEMRRQFDAAFPQKGPDGEPYSYMGRNMTLNEIEGLLESGLPAEAMGDRPNEAITMIYSEAGQKSATFPVIVQVKGDEPPPAHGVVPRDRIAGVAVFYKEGFAADLLKPDEGATETDAHVGMPILRMAATDDPAQSVSTVQKSLANAAQGAVEHVVARESPAPGSLVVHFRATERGEIDVRPADGVAHEKFKLGGDRDENYGLVWTGDGKMGVRLEKNELLDERALLASFDTKTTVVALAGTVGVQSALSLGEVLLTPTTGNVFVETGSGGTTVVDSPENKKRDPNTTIPITVGPAPGTDPGGGAAPGTPNDTAPASNNPSGK